jgi:hypothetical protein
MNAANKQVTVAMRGSLRSLGIHRFNGPAVRTRVDGFDAKFPQPLSELFRL